MTNLKKGSIRYGLGAGLGLVILSACGFLAKKEGKITKEEKPAAVASSEPAGRTQGEANTEGTTKQSQTPGPSASPASTQNTNSNGSSSGVTGGSGLEKVTEGGPDSGLLENGTVYFAPGDTVFFHFSYQIASGQTQVNASIYFKDTAPTETIASHVHAGSCADAASKHYQHLAGDATAETSEIHVSLTGTGNKKSGMGIGKFVPRNEELSYVIHYNGGRLCAPFGPISPPAVATSPAPSASPGGSTVSNPVVAGGNVTGLLADGTPYFAGNDTIYYRYSYQTTSSSTTLKGEIYFKENGPTTDVASHLHEGTCANSTSPHYQHLPGDATSGTSELHVNLSGSPTAKKGATTVSFVPRNVPLSYVIHWNGMRFCSDLNGGGSQTPSPSPSGTQNTGVTPGGSVSGLLPDGTPYFAPGHTFFFIVNYTTSNNSTTVTGQIYYKSNGPSTDLQSYIHSGKCSNATSPRYQHIPGDATPEKSEIHVPLKGSTTVKTGSGKGNFALRNEPISYVIETSSGRLCAEIK